MAENEVKDNDNTVAEDIMEEKLQGEPEVVLDQDSAEVVNNEAEKEENDEKSFFGKKKLNAEIKALNDKLAEKEKQLEESKDRYARLAAEYDNYKKRTAKELDSRYTDAKADTVKNFLEVLDNFERALKVEIPPEAQDYKKGVELICKQFTDVLKAFGVEEIPSLGEEFNPEYHNAVMHEDNEEVGENIITDVFVKGYKIGDKILRYSMVKVAN